MPWGRSTVTGGQLGVGSGWGPGASGVTPRLLGKGQRDSHPPHPCRGLVEAQVLIGFRFGPGRPGFLHLSQAPGRGRATPGASASPLSTVLCSERQRPPHTLCQGCCRCQGDRLRTRIKVPCTRVFTSGAHHRGHGDFSQERQAGPPHPPQGGATCTCPAWRTSFSVCTVSSCGAARLHESCPPLAAAASAHQAFPGPCRGGDTGWSLLQPVLRGSPGMQPLLSCVLATWLAWPPWAPVSARCWGVDSD